MTLRQCIIGLVVLETLLGGASASAEDPDGGASARPQPDASAPPQPDASAQAPTESTVLAPQARPHGLHFLRVLRHGDDQGDYTTRRFEPAGFPLIGGDSDIGFEFGAVGTLTHFADGTKPYQWNMDLLLSASVKQGPSGPEIAQQNYLWQIDVPDLFGGLLRLNPEASYNHTINYGYFGLGNASSGTLPASNPNVGRYHEWIDTFLQLRSSARVHLDGPVSAMFAVQYLYVDPTAYVNSALAQDAAAKNADGSPRIYGTTPLSLPSLAAGFVYDSRDDEIFPTRGMLHEVGVRFEQGFPTGADTRYAEAGAILRGYVPIAGPFVAAGRLVTNFQFGNVPFYDLFQAGPFDQKEMPGGSAGIRGVPVGRYLGPIKIIGNIELRAMLVQFTVLKQEFTIGNDIFFDTGRVWSDYSFHSPLDGHGVGLKYGVGGGIYVLWGQAAMLRIEAGYSPDAVSENPTLPVGIYVEDGTMF
jgi:hypothetical protein